MVIEKEKEVYDAFMSILGDRENSYETRLEAFTRLMGYVSRKPFRDERKMNWTGPIRTYKISGYRAERRFIVHEMLGWECARCTFDDPRALHVDHIEACGKGGRTTEAKMNRDIEFCYENKIKRYQILCANCNNIKMRIMREYSGR